jgi:Cu2+-exporting ATPase
MAVRSSHPKSRAIARALEELGAAAAFESGRVVRELAGLGLETEDAGQVWRLGAGAWAMSAPADGDDERDRSNGDGDDRDVLLTRDGVVIARIATVEEARPGARAEVLELQREGYETCVLSGDSPEATRAMAAACGIPEANAFGARTPEGKAAWLRQLDAQDSRDAQDARDAHAARAAKKTLFVGDGINDSLVAEEAYCAGTPAIDRPFMAARCDFYFVSPGLGPVREALHMAKRLARVVHVNLAVAVFYNAVTVTLAVAGLMTPLWCAVLMPLSSLSTVLVTTAQLTRRAHVPKRSRRAWTS